MGFHGPARAEAHAICSTTECLDERLHAGASPVLICCSRREQLPLRLVFLMKKCDRNHGAVVSVQRTLLTPFSTQDAFDVLTLL